MTGRARRLLITLLAGALSVLVLPPAAAESAALAQVGECYTLSGVVHLSSRHGSGGVDTAFGRVYGLNQCWLTDGVVAVPSLSDEQSSVDAAQWHRSVLVCEHNH